MCVHLAHCIKTTNPSPTKIKAERPIDTPPRRLAPDVAHLLTKQCRNNVAVLRYRCEPPCALNFNIAFQSCQDIELNVLTSTQPSCVLNALPFIPIGVFLSRKIKVQYHSVQGAEAGGGGEYSSVSHTRELFRTNFVQLFVNNRLNT